ncbi:MAG: ATP-binding cassette domain-containing protein [Deltaproteobacteria bacterium]
MLLEVSHIDFSVGKTQILRSVSLKVNEGELVGLVGRNGAGKSSILKSIIGLYQPQQGTVTFKGRDITKVGTRQRVLAGLAYSPEDARVFPEITVEENIRLGMWVAEDREGNGEKFELEDGFRIFPRLKGLLDRKAGTLSGGEKKMVSITRALALGPSLLLLDESLEGLSPLVVRQFAEAAGRIREMGVSVALAESNLRNASLVVERTYVVERGEILFEGTPEEIAQDERLSTIVGR